MTYRTPDRHLFDRYLDQVSAALPSLPDVCSTADLARVFRNSQLFWKIKRREATAPNSSASGSISNISARTSSAGLPPGWNARNPPRGRSSIVIRHRQLSPTPKKVRPAGSGLGRAGRSISPTSRRPWPHRNASAGCRSWCSNDAATSARQLRIGRVVLSRRAFRPRVRSLRKASSRPREFPRKRIVGPDVASRSSTAAAHQKIQAIIAGLNRPSFPSSQRINSQSGGLSASIL